MTTKLESVRCNDLEISDDSGGGFAGARLWDHDDHIGFTLGEDEVIATWRFLDRLVREHKLIADEQELKPPFDGPFTSDKMPLEPRTSDDILNEALHAVVNETSLASFCDKMSVAWLKHAGPHWQFKKGTKRIDYWPTTKRLNITDEQGGQRLAGRTNADLVRLAKDIGDYVV